MEMKIRKAKLDLECAKGVLKLAKDFELVVIDCECGQDIINDWSTNRMNATAYHDRAYDRLQHLYAEQNALECECLPDQDVACPACIEAIRAEMGENIPW